MIINNVFLQVILSQCVKPPKLDFVNYCHDFAKQESAFVNSNCFTNDFGFSFADIFDQTIAPNKKILSFLQSSPYCIIAHTTPEYDPDYSHVGVYLKNHHAFLGEIVDVIGRDESVRCTAHHLLSRFFQRGLADRGAIILFEQSVIPVSKQKNSESKRQNGVSVFLVSR